MYTEAYKKLERSLTDNITEAQAKLGYSKKYDAVLLSTPYFKSFLQQ